MMDIAKRIMQLCNERNITPNKLADLSDLSQSTLSGILGKSKKIPNLNTLDKICDGLGITLADFFTEQQPDYLPFESRQALKKFEDFLRQEYKEYLKK